MKLKDPKIDFIEKIIRNKNKNTYFYSTDGMMFFDCTIEFQCADCKWFNECDDIFKDDLPHLYLDQSKEFIKNKYPEFFI